MKKDNGGPAFPSHWTMGEVVQQGMSLRQWYAGMALNGLLSQSPSSWFCSKKSVFEIAMEKDDNVKKIAGIALEFADAMIERSRADEKE